MSFETTAYRVMVCSPGDTDDERQRIVLALQKWNIRYAEDREYALIPWTWELASTAVSGVGGQAALNMQLVETCDVMVAIFKHRFGSSSKEYGSGTAEEIAGGRKRKLNVGVFYSNESVPQEHIAESNKIREYRQAQEAKGDVYHRHWGDIPDLVDAVMDSIHHQVGEIRASKETFTKAKSKPDTPPFGSSVISSRTVTRADAEQTVRLGKLTMGRPTNPAKTDDILNVKLDPATLSTPTPQKSYIDNVKIVGKLDQNTNHSSTKPASSMYEKLTISQNDAVEPPHSEPPKDESPTAGWRLYVNSNKSGWILFNSWGIEKGISGVTVTTPGYSKRSRKLSASQMSISERFTPNEYTEIPCPPEQQNKINDALVEVIDLDSGAKTAIAVSPTPSGRIPVPGNDRGRRSVILWEDKQPEENKTFDEWIASAPTPAEVPSDAKVQERDFTELFAFRRKPDELGWSLERLTKDIIVLQRMEVGMVDEGRKCPSIDSDLTGTMSGSNPASIPCTRLLSMFRSHWNYIEVDYSIDGRAYRSSTYLTPSGRMTTSLNDD